MATLVASYPVDTGGSDNTDTLVSASFDPANGEILVVKMATWDTSSTMNAPTASASSGSAPTFTSRVVYNPASSKPWMAIYTAEVSGSPVGVVVSATHSATASMHSMVVERWGSASLGSPVASGQATADGQPLATLTTTGADSVITAVNADWHGGTGARTYRGSGVEVHAYQQGGNTSQYYWYAPVAVAGLTQFGMTAPTGQSYALAGIELLNADSGTEQGLGLASSTDTVHALGRSLGSVGDTGTAYSLGSAKAKPLGVGGSTDAVHGLGRTKSAQLGLVTETSSVSSVGRAKSQTLGVPTETDAVAQLGRGKAQSLGAVSGTESVAALARTKSKTVGSISGSDLVLLLATGTPTLGLIGGVDATHTLSRTKQREIVSVSESGSALALGRSKRILLGLASEIGNAGLLGRTKSQTLGLASGLDVANSVGSGQPTVREIGKVSEIGRCLVIGRLETRDGPLTDAVPFLVGRGNRYR